MAEGCAPSCLQVAQYPSLRRFLRYIDKWAIPTEMIDIFCRGHELSSTIPASVRRNTVIRFQLYDTTKTPLVDSASSIYVPVIKALMEQYPGNLSKHLAYGFGTGIWLQKSWSDEWKDCLRPISPPLCWPSFYTFINRIPCGFKSKPNSKLRKIIHMSFPDNLLVNYLFCDALEHRLGAFYLDTVNSPGCK